MSFDGLLVAIKDFLWLTLILWGLVLGVIVAMFVAYDIDKHYARLCKFFKKEKL